MSCDCYSDVLDNYCHMSTANDLYDFFLTHHREFPLETRNLITILQVNTSDDDFIETLEKKTTMEKCNQI